MVFSLPVVLKSSIPTGYELYYGTDSLSMFHTKAKHILLNDKITYKTTPGQDEETILNSPRKLFVPPYKKPQSQQGSCRDSTHIPSDLAYSVSQ